MTGTKPFQKRYNLSKSLFSLAFQRAEKVNSSKVRSYLCLCKVKISFFAALSAATGLLLVAHKPWPALPPLVAGVFLMACGACALNHWQERATDALMRRTAKRPIPSGRIKPGHALVFGVALIFAGAVTLLFTGVLAAPLLGLSAAFWYNGFYIWFKSRNAFAAIPGALVGAIPPAMGWITGGGSLLDARLAVLSFFFFMWQVPHFFIHLLVFGKEYEEAGFPSLTTFFTGDQLDRLTFQWIMATSVSLQLVIIYGPLQSPLIHMSLIAVSLWLAINGINFIRAHVSGYTGVFKRTNHFMLMVMLFMFFDKLPGFLF